MNANMIPTWLKDPRFAPVADEPVLDAVFLPVEIDGSFPTGDAATKLIYLAMLLQDAYDLFFAETASLHRLSPQLENRLT